MKTFKKIMSESKTDGKLAQEHLPAHVHVTERLYTSGFPDAIAAIKQKTAKDDQIVFVADSYDYQEFGKGLKSNEILVRVSTPLSKVGSSEHRQIAKVNVKTGKLAFINNDLYETGTIKWQRPLKLDFLTIDRKFLDYFKIW